MEMSSRSHRGTLSLIWLWLSAASLAHGADYSGFKKLDPNSCIKLDDGATSKLPTTWQTYKGFIRSCSFQRKADEIAKVSIIAVWVDDYYAQRPSDAAWEDFPKPLLVDQHKNEIGKLPELYPSEDPREMDIYYGKWQSGVPTEIRVDIHNPAVSGDYFYPPIILYKRTGKYVMQAQEVTYGRRRK